MKALFLLFLIIGSFSVSATPAGPDGVLVLYSVNWPDSNGNGLPDTRDLAEYYMQRRGIPAQNILGIPTRTGTGYNTSMDGALDYSFFYDSILTKVNAKLESYDGPVKFRDKIYYIVMTYGIPYKVNTNFATDNHPLWPGGSYAHNIRSLDQWLVNIDTNVAGTYEAGTNRPIRTAGGSYIGVTQQELFPSWYSHITRYTASPTTFKEARDLNRAYYNYYLVTRIDGHSLMHAKSLVDKALYAERYLQNLSATPEHPYHGVGVFDQDFGTDAGHAPHLVNTKRWFDGADTYSPFKTGGPLGPWSLIVDGHTDEIGQNSHLPIVSAQVATAGVDTAQKRLTLNFTSTKYYLGGLFTAGKTIVNHEGDTAVIDSIANAANPSYLFINDASGFDPLDSIFEVGPDQLLVPNTLFYYGYYTFGAYYDVYKFQTGALGFHMDSGSRYWSMRAIRRNITATGGAVSEPALTIS